MTEAQVSAESPAPRIVAEPGESGVIVAIQRLATRDGSTPASLVLFKGCPVACPWCGGAETQRVAPELCFDQDRCIVCQACVDACPAAAVRRSVSGLSFEAGRCRACGACTQVCYPDARWIVGRRVPADRVVAELLRDEAALRAGGGGVVLGGGEPLLQPAFAREILRGCREGGLGTVVETCGLVPWEGLEAVRPWTDRFRFDVTGQAAGAEGTGPERRDDLAWSNLGRLLSSGSAVSLRLLVIPGRNDRPADVRAVAERAAALGVSEISLAAHARRVLPGAAQGWGRSQAPDPGMDRGALEALSTAAAGTGVLVQVAA